MGPNLILICTGGNQMSVSGAERSPPEASYLIGLTNTRY